MVLKETNGLERSELINGLERAHTRPMDSFDHLSVDFFQDHSFFQDHLSVDFFQDHKFPSRPFINSLLSRPLLSFKTIYHMASFKTFSFFQDHYQFTSFKTIYHLASFKTFSFFQDHLSLTSFRTINFFQDHLSIHFFQDH